MAGTPPRPQPTGRGISRITVARPTSGAGTQTTEAEPRRAFEPRSAFATATPTASGVVDSGAAGIPSVIFPITKPGRTSSTRTPVPCSESA